MNPKINRFVLPAGIFLFGILLSGCRMGRDYQRPNLGLPANYSEQATDTTTIADLPWETFFQTPELKALIDSGLAYNQDLQAALQRLDAANALVKQSRVAGLPTLDAGISAQSSRPSDNSLNGQNISEALGRHHIEDYSAYAALSWEVDIWGRIRRNKEAALAAYLGTYQATRAVRTRVIADIATGYYTLLMLDEQLRVARRNLALSDSTVALTRLEQEAGLVTDLAVQQAEAQAQSTREIIPRLERQRALQENALRLLTGRYPGIIDRQGSLANLEIRDSLRAGIPAQLVSRRPDVRQQEMALVQANAEVGIAKADLYPALTLTASGGLNALKASDWFNIPASLFGVVTGGIAEPVFRHRQLRSQWEIAKARREEEVAAFRQVVLQAAGEVENALVSQERLREVDSIATLRKNTTQKAVQQAQLLFKSGMATYLEVITAQQQALEAELNLAQVREGRLENSVVLYRALGGGQ